MDLLLGVSSISPNLHNIMLSDSQAGKSHNILSSGIHPSNFPPSFCSVCVVLILSLCAFSITFREMRNEGDVVCLSGPLFREEKVCEIAVKEEEEEAAR